MSCGGNHDGSENANSKKIGEVVASHGVYRRDAEHVFHGMIKDIRNDNPDLSPEEIQEIARNTLDQAFADPDSLPDEFITTRERLAAISPSGKILDSDTAFGEEIRGIISTLDRDQQHDVVKSSYDQTLRRLKREKVDPEAPVDADKWREWCERQAERVSEEDPALAQKYLDMSDKPVKDMATFETMKRLRYRAIYGPKSEEREIRQIAGMYDISYEDARAAYDSARAEYLAKPFSERPEVPQWHETAVAFSYLGKDTSKKPPLDGASAYALYAVSNEPERVASAPRERRGYVVFDTETTGIESDASILQFTAIAYDADGNEVDRISTYVNPGADETGSIYVGSPDAVKVHGITEDKVRNAPTFEDIAPRVAEVMGTRTRVAHNLYFDWPKVQRAMSGTETGALESGPQVDTLRIARYKQPNPGVPNKEWRHTLKDSSVRAGLEFDEEKAHDSLYDVERTAALFSHLVRGVR